MHPGYSTDQELWTLQREGDRVDPEFVLLEFCPNDLDGNETTIAHRMLKPRFVFATDDRWRIADRPCATFMPAPDEDSADGPLDWSATWQVISGRTPLVAPPTVPLTSREP